MQVLYAETKLSTQQLSPLDAGLEKIDFACGTSLVDAVPPDAPSSHILYKVSINYQQRWWNHLHQELLAIAFARLICLLLIVIICELLHWWWHNSWFLSHGRECRHTCLCYQPSMCDYVHVCIASGHTIDKVVGWVLSLASLTYSGSGFLASSFVEFAHCCISILRILGLHKRPSVWGPSGDGVLQL